MQAYSIYMACMHYHIYVTHSVVFIAVVFYRLFTYDFCCNLMVAVYMRAMCAVANEHVL